MSNASRKSTYPLAVVLPAYNEDKTIGNTIRDFSEQLPDAFFVVVDNNSSDGTNREAKKALELSKARGVVLTESRQGKGWAVRRALQSVDADVYVMVDADETYPAISVPQLLEALEEHNADLVVGDRHTSGDYKSENSRRLHGFGNRLVARLVNWFFKAELTDVMSGLRVLSKRFVKAYPIMVNGFELETDMTLFALDKRFKIVEVPIEYRDRPEGSTSKLNTIPDGTRVIYAIFQLLRYYRPLFFFGWIAFAFLILGLAAGSLPILDYASSGYVEHVPLAILATGLEIFALVLFAVGLILDSISHAEKMRFERET